MRNQIINKYKINAFTSKQDFLREIVNKKKILIAMNAEKIVRDNIELIGIVNSNIGYPDGVGAVMALKHKNLNSIKIAGSEFWLDIIASYSSTKSFYFIGSTTKVIQLTVKKLKKDFSDINIVGYRDGFFKDGDKEKLIKELQEKKPDIIFVAQGSPRQEFLMSELIEKHPALYMGLGGSFDIYGGNKKRAPKFFLKWNLEWFYRLLKEPTRFSRQISLIKFLFLLNTDKYFGKKAI